VSAIHLDHLTKIYRVPVREAGLRASVRSLVKREQREIVAVDRISFDIEAGEIVGFLGPNGAGKTTTLKMLSGLLYPDGGVGEVLGHVPSQRRREFLRRITLVMGNRQQLSWDLPAMDSFELNKSIYRLDTKAFEEARDEFIELLDLGALVDKPIRNLSLGERMKMEIAGALLHRPEVLFLDEPTIGLDVTAQRKLREFIAEYNGRYGATVMLTSHYMADVVALAKRVIVIDHGRILYDGDLTGLGSRFAAHKTITVTMPSPPADLSSYGPEIGRDVDNVTFEVPRADTSRLAARLLADFEVSDLTIEDPPIEEVIERVFADPGDDLEVLA
jgi:ABC-2 type transport system ATP-binding protein